MEPNYKHFLQRTEELCALDKWTAAMGVMIVHGLDPAKHSTSIPLRAPWLLYPDRLASGGDLSNARAFFESWLEKIAGVEWDDKRYYQKMEEASRKELAPREFLIDCHAEFRPDEPPMLYEFLEVLGQPYQPITAAARASLKTESTTPVRAFESSVHRTAPGPGNKSPLQRLFDDALGKGADLRTVDYRDLYALCFKIAADDPTRYPGLTLSVEGNFFCFQVGDKKKQRYEPTSLKANLKRWREKAKGQAAPGKNPST